MRGRPFCTLNVCDVVGATGCAPKNSVYMQAEEAAT
jgi:hypothetical protein